MSDGAIRWLMALALLLLASAASAHGAVHERIDAATRALGERPDDAALLLERGALHVLDENWTQAKLDFEEARGLDPALPGIDLRLATALLQLGEAARVVELLDQVLEREPHNADAHLVRARAHVELDQAPLASADFSRVIELSTTPIPRTYRERASAIASQGPAYVDEAVRSLREGMTRLGPAVTLVEMAIALEVGRGGHDVALALVQLLPEALRLTPMWRVRRAEILAEAGRAAEADEGYRGALEAIDGASPSRRHTKALQQLRAKIVGAREQLTVTRPRPPADEPSSPRGWLLVLLVLAVGATFIAMRRRGAGAAR